MDVNLVLLIAAPGSHPSGVVEPELRGPAGPAGCGADGCGADRRGADRRGPGGRGADRRGPPRDTRVQPLDAGAILHDMSTDSHRIPAKPTLDGLEDKWTQRWAKERVVQV